MFLAATVLLTWFAIRPSARPATDAQTSDDADIVDA
jgi:hypothetical protein